MHSFGTFYKYQDCNTKIASITIQNLLIGFLLTEKIWAKPTKNMISWAASNGIGERFYSDRWNKKYL